MYDELVKRLRDAATMSEALAVLLPHSEGNATAKLYNEAADAIEELSKLNDVQPVVRCINCKYYEGLACCKLIGDCGGTNWFCGWGEPKEET